MGKKSDNYLLSEILDLKKVRVVSNPIDKAHGLPNECYTCPDYLEYEKERIFKDKWTVIGVGNSIPNIGDAKPYNLLGIPLILLRGKDKKVRVFHNVCSHRGFKLLDDFCSLKNTLICPYHGWAYDFEGKLVATPHIGGLNIHKTDKFDKLKSNLKEVKSKIWMDIIFVNINENEMEFNKIYKTFRKQMVRIYV